MSTSLTSSQNQELQFISENGLELFIHNDGSVHAGQSAMGKMLDQHPTTLVRFMEKDPITYSSVTRTKYDSGSGLRSITLYPVETLVNLAFAFKPELAKEMCKMGATLYLYKLAGYKVKLAEPEPAKPQNQALQNIEWAKAYILQETQKLNIEQFPGMKRMIDHLQTEGKEAEAYPPFSVYAYLVNEDCLELLDKKLFNTFNRRVASLYRVCHQKKPMRANCVLTGKRANLYTENDLVILEQAFDTLDI